MDSDARCRCRSSPGEARASRAPPHVHGEEQFHAEAQRLVGVPVAVGDGAGAAAAVLWVHESDAQDAAPAGESAAARVRPVETLLRAAPLGLCVAAMTVMLRDQQSNEYGTVAYSDLGGFEYLVYANVLIAAYSLVSTFYTAVPRPATVSHSWVVFLLDQVRSCLPSLLYSHFNFLTVVVAC